MKRFVIFILIISCLILSSHYFFTEIFSERRPLVLGLSFVLILSSVFGVMKFAKRNIINTKHY